MSRKIDFIGIGITLPHNSDPFIHYRFDSYEMCDRFRKCLKLFGLTDEEITPMVLYFFDALYGDKPWPPTPPFDAPEHYTGPTVD